MKQEANGKPGQLPVKKGLFPWPLPPDRKASLLGSKCDRCGEAFFPARERCPHCLGQGRIEPIDLSRRGKLYSYTIVRQAPKAFSPPYATAYIDLPEGVRVFAQLTTVDPAEIKVDGPVELNFGPIARDAEGNEIISYKFKPVSE